MENKCLYEKYCGGCSLWKYSYPKQLVLKNDYINKLLGSFTKVEPIIGMEDPLYYRNKIQVSFGYDEKRRVICGNYVPSSHTIVPIDNCLIIDERANEIINSIVRLINKYKISIFDERAYKGCLRHLLIKTTNTNEIMLVLVTGSFNIVKKDLFIKDILKYNPSITTIVQNFNNKHTSMILGERNTVLYGRGYVYDNLCGFKFKISPSSFYQINKRQTEILYKKALELADFKGDEILVDAYCGTGTIGIIASKNVKKVLGVEINKEAIRDAIKNAKINDISNIEFVADDAGNYMDKLARNKKKIDALILDPPRSGASKKFLNSVYRLKPNKIIYISCGPESLKNNLFDLSKNGYKVKRIVPVDMFPYTSIGHVETICLLVRNTNVNSEKAK